MDNAVYMIFDTNCVLCSATVHFITAREVEDSPLVFVNAWGEQGQVMGQAHGFERDDLQASFVVVRDGQAFTRSAACFEIARHLRAPWCWLRMLRILPVRFLDWGYELVARNRYRWFGRKDRCFVPDDRERHRFVD